MASSLGVGLAGAGAGALDIAGVLEGALSEDLKRFTRSSSAAMRSFSVSA